MNKKNLSNFQLIFDFSAFVFGSNKTYKRAGIASFYLLEPAVNCKEVPRETKFFAHPDTPWAS